MMHLARLIFFTLLVIVVLFSCGNPTENKIEEHIPSIGDVTWLEGVWQDTSNKNQFEIWSRAGSELLGNGIYVRKGDTSYFEQLRIAELENGLIYEATVKEDQGPVRFLITYLGDSNMVFENPSHDFPKTISYRLFGRDKNGHDILKADVMGDNRMLTFTMVKIR